MLLPQVDIIDGIYKKLSIRQMYGHLYISPPLFYLGSILVGILRSIFNIAVVNLAFRNTYPFFLQIIYFSFQEVELNMNFTRRRKACWISIYTGQLKIIVHNLKRLFLLHVFQIIKKLKRISLNVVSTVHMF